MNYYLYIGLFVSGLLIGGSSAYKVMSWKADSDKLESVQRTIDQMVQLEQQNDEISTRFERQADRIRTRYHTIYNTIATDNRDTTCVIPDEWVQQWNSANLGEEATSSSDNTLPTTTTTTTESNP
jgi:hypothetical protein